jgi:hypothetical protein
MMIIRSRRSGNATILESRRGGGATGECSCCHAPSAGIVVHVARTGPARTDPVCDFHLSMASMNAVRFFAHLKTKGRFGLSAKLEA